MSLDNGPRNGDFAAYIEERLRQTALAARLNPAPAPAPMNGSAPLPSASPSRSAPDAFSQGHPPRSQARPASVPGTTSPSATPTAGGIDALNLRQMAAIPVMAIGGVLLAYGILAGRGAVIMFGVILLGVGNNLRAAAKPRTAPRQSEADLLRRASEELAARRQR